MSTEAIASPSTALTVPQRAAVAFKSAEREKQLVALAAESVTITVITNAAGREQCHAAMMRLKNARIDVEKEGKEIRDDAVKFGKGVIAEENRLIAITSAEEMRLQTLRDAWDSRIAAEKQARLDAENARKAAIAAKIEAIRSSVVECAGKYAQYIDDKIAELSDMDINLGGFDEFVAQAKEARDYVVLRLREMYTERLAFEAAQEKLRLDAIAAAALKIRQDAEAAAAAKLEAEKVAAERAELAKLRAENERLAKLEQDRQAEAARREREQLDRERQQQEAAAKIERERIAAEAEVARKAHEQREAEAKRVRDAEEARIAADRQKLADEQQAIELKAQRARTEAQEAERAIILGLVADKFQLSPEMALAKLRELFG